MQPEMENTIENDTAPHQPLLSRGWAKLSWLRNKYLIASLLFLVWMLFFDPKDVGSSFNRWQKSRELQASEQELTKRINETKLERGQLMNNAQTIEKYAREKYLMKKDNEDLFIINEPKTEK